MSKYNEYEGYGTHIEFSDGSVARKANPRNLPCPTCHQLNRLTHADEIQGYQCDECTKTRGSEIRGV